jgi:hypothetical protein
MVAALVMVWSLRLGLHISVRSAGSHDDPRYAAYAQQWGDAAPRKTVAAARASPAFVDLSGKSAWRATCLRCLLRAHQFI